MRLSNEYITNTTHRTHSAEVNIRGGETSISTPPIFKKGAFIFSNGNDLVAHYATYVL